MLVYSVWYHIVCVRMVKSQILPCLEKMKTDGDADVRFFASESLQGKYEFISLYGTGLFP